MTPLLIIERNLKARKLSSLLTALGVALGVMVLSAVLQIREQLHDSYMTPGRGYSLVVGAPGSRLQLVLSAVYHVEESPGLMPMSAFEELRRSPSVDLAVPLVTGDSFRGYRVVGTTSAFFSPKVPHAAAPKLAAGRGLTATFEDVRRTLDGAPAQSFEAVLGAEVAAELGLGVGRRIEPSHGIKSTMSHSEDHQWTVVGVLERSSTPVDRLVLVNMDSFFAIEEHGGGVIPETGEQGLSSVLLFPKPGMHKGLVLSRLRKSRDVQVADVQVEVQRLLGLIGNVDRMFLLVAAMVVVIGVISIMVSIYNTMNERRVEISTLRAIGARRRTVFMLVLGEASILAVAGGLAGVLLGHLLIWGISGQLRTAGLLPSPWMLASGELVVLGLVAVVGAAAGTVPALKAYRTDIARGLSGTP